jgi:hypothetical protein
VVKIYANASRQGPVLEILVEDNQPCLQLHILAPRTPVSILLEPVTRPFIPLLILLAIQRDIVELVRQLHLRLLSYMKFPYIDHGLWRDSIAYLIRNHELK